MSEKLAKYILIRALESVPCLLSVILIAFILIRLAPGSPLLYLAGDFALSPEYEKEIISKYGLDEPLYMQFLKYLRNVCMGDLGYSIFYKTSVLSLILERMPATILLMLSSLLISIFLGLFIGIFMVMRKGSMLEHALTVSSLIGYALPSFWLGQMLILVFSIYLGIFPSQGMTSPKMDPSGFYHLFDILRHLFLPALTLGSLNLAVITRLTKSKLFEVLQEDYIMLARSIGLSETAIIFKHALKNASLPIITVIGMNVGYMFAGAVLTERVFSWPGLGRLLYDSIYARDYPMVSGIFITIATATIVSNLVTDLVYAFIDPRIRYK